MIELESGERSASARTPKQAAQRERAALHHHRVGRTERLNNGRNRKTRRESDRRYEHLEAHC